MKDQIIDPRGAPLTQPQRYLEEFDNATMPVADAEGKRMYLGLSKPELFAINIFAHGFRHDQAPSDEMIERYARDCKRAALILLKVMREPS